MKQFLFLILITMVGSAAALFEPFWGVLLYYTFAVLRPQYLWKWALPIGVRWSAICAFVVFISIFLNLHKVLAKGRLNGVIGLMIAYGMLLMLSVLLAYNPVTAQYWGVQYAKLMLMAIIATLVINNLQQIRLIAVMILLMLGYVAWEINSLYIFDGRLDIFHNGYGNLDNNGAGLLLAMPIPFAYCFGVAASKKWQRAASWFLGLLMIHAVLMSYSRGAMIAALLGIFWLLIHHRSRLQAALVVVVLCIAVSLLAGPEIRDRFISTKDYQSDFSSQSRFDSWQAAWEMAWDRPFTGIGIRNSTEYLQNYGADRVGRAVHNQYLQTAADSGIPAVAVYILMVGTAMVYAGRGRRMCIDFLNLCPSETPNDVQDSVSQIEYICLGCQGSLIVFAIGGMFLSLEVVEFPWLLLVLAGVMPRVVDEHLDGLAERYMIPDLVRHPPVPKPMAIRPISPMPRGLPQP